MIPGNFKAPIKVQNIHINNRYILDKQLHKVTTNALAAAFGDDNFHYIANFHLPADTIDVNVHPNKTTIKVMDQSKMMGVLSSSIKSIAAKKSPIQNSSFITKRDDTYNSQSFFVDMANNSDLQQDRHQYNMDGLFSPHKIPHSSNESNLWIGQTIIKNNGTTWIAISSIKLLEFYCYTRIKKQAPTIPLLVSEPFPAKKVKKETIENLHLSGMEIEYLGSETIVIRGIPEWMNGFPLKDIIQCLLLEKSFSEIILNPSDWSQSTWEDMLLHFKLEELLTNKIVLDLSLLLKEKFK